MKKINIPITIAIIGILSILGCGQKTDIGLRFKMEKMLINADRLADQVRQKGQTVSDEDLKMLIETYGAIRAMITSPRDSSEIQNAPDERRQAWALSSLAATRIGLLYMESKTYDKAFDCFKAISDNPATSPIQRNAVSSYLALALEKLQRYPEAAAFYDTLAINYQLLISPDNPNMDAIDAPLKSAKMWNKAGDYEKYLAGMEKARTYYNELARKFRGTLMESAALGKIAASFIEQLKYPEAIKTLRSVPPDSSGHTGPAILLMIADIYMNNLNDYPAAEKTYREFAAYYPENGKIAAATLGIGLSLYEQGKYPEARKAVENIEKLPNTDQKSVAGSYYLTGLCYERDDKWDLAKGQFNMVMATFPGTNEGFEAALYVANHNRIAGNKILTQKAVDEAVEYINKYVKHETDQAGCARAMGYMVRVYTENGEMEKAVEQLAMLHQRYPQFPEGRLAPLRLADINENILDNPSKAVVWLKTFVNENPDASNINEIKSHIETLEAHLGNSK